MGFLRVGSIGSPAVLFDGVCFKGTTKRKYKIGSLKRLLRPGNNERHFIANSERVVGILKKADEAVATHQPVPGQVSITS